MTDPVEEIKDFKVSDLNELSQKLAELTGLWELTAEGQALYNQQRDTANSNAQLAASIKERLATVERLREKLEMARYSLQTKHNEWQVAEAEMHTAIAPFSLVGIADRLGAEYNEAETISNGLRNSFLESADNTDVAAFVRNYRAQRTQARLHQFKLQGLNK